jgi:hypothetical protein
MKFNIVLFFITMTHILILVESGGNSVPDSLPSFVNPYNKESSESIDGKIIPSSISEETSKSIRSFLKFLIKLQK